MAIEDWPAGLYPQQMEWRLRDTGVQFRSPFSGTLQSVGFAGEHWLCNMTLPGRRSDKGAFDPGPKLSAFIHWWKGGINQARMYDAKYQIPRGTFRAATLQTQVVRGNTSIILTAGSGVTALAGDKFSLGGQWFEIKNDATAAGTVLTLTVVNRVRETITAGSAITWDKPTVNMILPEMSAGVLYTPGFHQPVSLQAEEAL